MLSTTKTNITTRQEIHLPSINNNEKVTIELNNSLMELHHNQTHTHTLSFKDNLAGNIAINEKKLTDLPIEIHKKIACKLDIRSYANLRETSKVFSYNLNSFEELIDKSINIKPANTAKSDYEYFLENIRYAKLSTEIFADEKVCEALKTLEVSTIDAKNGCFIISTQINTPPNNELYRTLRDITESIDRKFAIFYYKYDPDKRVFIFNLGFDMQWYDYNHSDIFPAQQLFSAFQKLYDTSTTKEKYLISALAEKVIKHWNEKPPRNNKTSTLRNINDIHKELIYVGNKINQIISDKEEV